MILMNAVPCMYYRAILLISRRRIGGAQLHIASIGGEAEILRLYRTIMNSILNSIHVQLYTCLQRCRPRCTFMACDEKGLMLFIY